MSRVINLLLGAALFAGSYSLYAQETLEYPIKATFLYKFAEFVSWPEQAIYDEFTICILGRDPYGPILENAIQGMSIKGRPVVAKRLSSIIAGSDCAVIYFGEADPQSTAEAIAAVWDKPILTVTDDAHPGSVRGIIHFVVSNDRVRFSIDPDAGARTGLIISSRLLDLSLR